MFQGCSSLKNIVFGNSVKSIDSSAFAFCSSLESIEYAGTTSAWNSITKGSYWNTSTGTYTIFCSNGEISKTGTVTSY